MANPEWDNYNPAKCSHCGGSGNEPAIRLPLETSSEWTEQDESDLRYYAEWSQRFGDRRQVTHIPAAFAREILRLRSEREAQDAEIAKLGRQHFAALSKLDDENSRLRSELSRSRSVGLPPDESPQRDAVCDALTEALIYIGIGCDEACERTSVNLLDAAEIRGLARMLTVRDAEGRDGSLGENTQRLWQRIADAVCAASVPNTGTALSEAEARVVAYLTDYVEDRFVHRPTRHDVASLLAIIDRLSSAPSRGSESDVDPEQAACARCGLPKREHQMGYGAHRCAFYALTAAPLVTESAGGQKP